MINLSNLKSVETREVTKFVASLIDGKWYGKTTTKKYPILIAKNKRNELHYIISSKTNNYWGEGVIRHHSKLYVETYEDYGFWTEFREGLEFEGLLINNVIHVDWKKHQEILRALYVKEMNKHGKVNNNSSQ